MLNISTCNMCKGDLGYYAINLKIHLQCVNIITQDVTIRQYGTGDN